jgi:hypothetical protein
MLLKPLLAVIVLVTGVILYGVVPALLGPVQGGETLRPFQMDPSTDNNGYRDLGIFANAVDTIDGDPANGGKYTVSTLVGSPSVLLGLQNPEKVVYFAAGVSRDYRAEEANALVDLEKAGGHLLIADDFGYANTLAQKFGIFYFGTDLWDLDDTNFPPDNVVPHYAQNISLPIVKFTFAGQDYYVEFNAPTGITLIQNPEVATNVIAHCSEKCYADIDRSGTVNIGDKKGNITTIIQARLQTNVTSGGLSVYVPTLGEAYFISDASVFSNEMMGTPKEHNATIRGNADFAVALIKTMLPDGGVLVIDDSRHLHNPGTQAIYSSVEATAVATSRAEFASMLIGGAALICAIVVLRAKDRENWIHKFDLSTFHPRALLPETGAVQLERLRNVARLKIQMTHSMSVEEFNAVPPDQLKTMIRDPMLIDLIMNPGRAWAPEELRPAAERIRTWGK